MKKIFLIITIMSIWASVSFAQNKTQAFNSFVRSVLTNSNVWKTADTLNVKMVYEDSKANPFKRGMIIRDTNSYKLIPSDGAFLRYKVIKVDDKNTYIRLLPGTYIDWKNNTISTEKKGEKTQNKLFKIISDRSPLNSYLASSAIVGKLLTVPLKLRWLEDKTEVEGAVEINYAFGYKIKLGNHPFKSHFLTVIPYAVGFSNQKYFKKLGEGVYSKKEDGIALNYWTLGLAYEWEKFNVGLFAGQDIMLGDNRDWVYQDKWWIGLGIGYNLIKGD